MSWLSNEAFHRLRKLRLETKALEERMKYDQMPLGLKEGDGNLSTGTRVDKAATYQY